MMRYNGEEVYMTERAIRAFNKRCNLIHPSIIMSTPYQRARPIKYVYLFYYSYSFIIHSLFLFFLLYVMSLLFYFFFFSLLLYPLFIIIHYSFFDKIKSERLFGNVI